MGSQKVRHDGATEQQIPYKQEQHSLKQKFLVGIPVLKDDTWRVGIIIVSSVRDRLILRNPLCCFLFLKCLLSLSAPEKQERAELQAVLRTEVMRWNIYMDSFQ